MSLDTQWLTLIVMLAAGAGMGVLFDSYRVVSDYFKFPRWSLSILDMLYWITCAVTVFRLLYLSNYGEVRGYVYIGLVIGVIIYAFIVSKPYSKLVILVIQFIQSVIRLIMKIIDYIIIKPMKILYKFVITCMKIGTKFTIRTFQIVLQLVIPILKVLFWPLKPLYLPIWRYIKKYWLKFGYPLLIRLSWLRKQKAALSKWIAVVKKWIYN